jgi:hypothetical protein
MKGFSQMTLMENVDLARFDSLHKLTSKLLRKTLYDTRKARDNSLAAMNARFYTTEFLLTEAQEFSEASWAELKAGRSRVSLAVSRWVLEAAMNLLWASMVPAECDERLKFLTAEALRQEGVLLNGLAAMNAEKAEELKIGQYATEAKKQENELRDQLTSKSKDYPSTIARRIESILPQLEALFCPRLYPLYRICCGAAHPGFDTWRLFQPGPGGSMIKKDRSNCYQNACSISAGAACWLAVGVYHLTQPDNVELHNSVMNLWAKTVVPIVSDKSSHRC